MAPETHEQRHARFARIRRAKWLLRFVPRRASLHRYPLIGRFADAARRRSYLWSFRSESVRPALYAGSITAFLPIMGVQIPVAFVLALALRVNVMVLVGLQFITNPFTAVPIYYGTYQLGQSIIHSSGFGSSVEVVPDDEYIGPEPASELDDSAPPHPVVKWTRRFGTATNAFVIGGLVGGAAVGFLLDLAWRFAASRAALHRARAAARHDHSASTHPRSPPM